MVDGADLILLHAHARLTAEGSGFYRLLAKLCLGATAWKTLSGVWGCLGLFRVLTPWGRISARVSLAVMVEGLRVSLPPPKCQRIE